MKNRFFSYTKIELNDFFFLKKKKYILNFIMIFKNYVNVDELTCW
jgi:hypothetical protein